MNSTTPRDPAFQELIDRQQVHDVIMRYCRGIDRCDIDVLRSVYHPDAIDDHGSFTGNAMEFCDFAMRALQEMERTMHRISNVLIELDGDTATSESYVIAYHYVRQDDGTILEMVLGGRYLDRFERREGEWKIAHRLFITDWNRNMPSTERREGWHYDPLHWGARAPDDPLYDKTLIGGKPQIV